MLILIALSTALALVSLGGAFYEFLVVDPFWPRRPEIIQPSRGGISRKRFWIPAHTIFELVLLVTLVLYWDMPSVRTPLLVALVSHAAMRVWSLSTTRLTTAPRTGCRCSRSAAPST